MANDGSKQGAPWPMPNMLFSVDIGEVVQNMAFQKVRGLRIGHDIVEYRGSNSPEYSNIKMPVGQTVSDVTLVKGMFAKDSTLWNWFNQVRYNTIKRETVVIKLLDEKNDVIFTWTLSNAFPKEIAFGELDSMAKSFAIEEMVIACERIEFSA